MWWPLWCCLCVRLIEEWLALCLQATNDRFSEGGSGAFVFTSHDERFLVKTLEKVCFSDTTAAYGIVVHVVCVLCVCVGGACRQKSRCC